LFSGLKILRQQWCASSSLASGTKIKGLAKNVFAKPFFNEEMSLEDALSQLFSPKQKEKHRCLFLVEFLRRDLGMAFFCFR